MQFLCAVYNFCHRMLGEPEAAEEAAQETFLRTTQNLARYDGVRPFATWLLSIAAHYCIDRLRRDRFHCFSIDTQDEKGIDLPDRRVPDPENEIARTLHLSLPAVKARLHRARRRLAKLWEEQSRPTSTRPAQEKAPKTGFRARIMQKQ